MTSLHLFWIGLLLLAAFFLGWIGLLLEREVTALKAGARASLLETGKQGAGGVWQLAGLLMGKTLGLVLLGVAVWSIRRSWTARERQLQVVARTERLRCLLALIRLALVLGAAVVAFLAAARL